MSAGIFVGTVASQQAHDQRYGLPVSLKMTPCYTFSADHSHSNFICLGNLARGLALHHCSPTPDLTCLKIRSREVYMTHGTSFADQVLLPCSADIMAPMHHTFRSAGSALFPQEKMNCRQCNSVSHAENLLHSSPKPTTAVEFGGW